MTKPGCEWKTFRFLIVFAAAGSLFLANTALVRGGEASETDARIKPEKLSNRAAEAWIVSTRCVSFSCPAGVGPERFSYRVSRTDCGAWESADADAFFASLAGDDPVIVFIHGNRTDSCDAIHEGRAVYQFLLCESGGRSFRFVIWSWPADKIRGGPRQDAVVKAARSDVQSFYLAAWLGRLPPGTPVSLIGYSFGARVTTGALQLAEGGSLLGRKIDKPPLDRGRRAVRVMLVAAAVDCEWLLPGSRDGLAGRRIEQMLITRNCCDPVLRLYPRMRRNDSSSALGFAGPASPGRLADSGLAFETVGVECQVGRNHSWDVYWGSSAIRSRLAWYAFLANETTSVER